jgi:hypothetical protein
VHARTALWQDKLRRRTGIPTGFTARFLIGKRDGAQRHGERNCDEEWLFHRAVLSVHLLVFALAHALERMETRALGAVVEIGL